MSQQTARPLLAPDEPAAFEVLNADGPGNVVLVCDHASNRIPQRLGTLGLASAQLTTHIAWDPGAAAVARRLSAQLDVPLVLNNYSRLVIDCNRPPTSTESILQQSAGIVIPGNQQLTSVEKNARIDTLFRPYHSAIEQLLERRAQRQVLFIGVHSFTPLLNDEARPWHIGISFWRDPRFAALLRDALRDIGGFIVGDNEPYPIEEHIDYTVPVHGEGRGLPSLMIEIRQDEIDTGEGVALWADRITQAYRAIETEALALFDA